MKKAISLLLAALVLFGCVSCGQPQETAVSMEPKISQMKAICDLAVMECYYHNVAKYTQEDAEGALWWKKDKHFWVEYSGIVELGIDVSQVDIKVDGTNITITLPAAEVLDCKVDSASLTEDSYIVDKDSASIEAEDEIKALAEAQRRLEEDAANNAVLLAEAQQRAQRLLEDYIHNIESAVGKTYSVEWIYLEPTPSN